MATAISSGSPVYPRRPISPSSTMGGKGPGYDEELHRPTAAQHPGQRSCPGLRAVFSTSTSSENETKRAMQSRHLMMIGEFPRASITVLAIFIVDVFSHWRNDWDRHIFECWIGEWNNPGFAFMFMSRLSKGYRTRRSRKFSTLLRSRRFICLYRCHYTVRPPPFYSERQSRVHLLFLEAKWLLCSRSLVHSRCSVVDLYPLRLDLR